MRNKEHTFFLSKISGNGKTVINSKERGHCFVSFPEGGTENWACTGIQQFKIFTYPFPNNS